MLPYTHLASIPSFDHKPTRKKLAKRVEAVAQEAHKKETNAKWALELPKRRSKMWCQTQFFVLYRECNSTQRGKGKCPPSCNCFDALVEPPRPALHSSAVTPPLRAFSSGKQKVLLFFKAVEAQNLPELVIRWFSWSCKSAPQIFCVHQELNELTFCQAVNSGTFFPPLQTLVCLSESST